MLWCGNNPKITDLLRNYQLSHKMKLLQIHNGYHNVYLSRTMTVKLLPKGGRP